MDLDNSDDIDDDWFYESIKRYKTLQMFHLQNSPEHVVQINEEILCVAGKNDKGENSELLQLKIPRKLTLSPEDEGRSKENDFKMLSGLYSEKPIYHMDRIMNTMKIITSEKDKDGLMIYDFNSTELGSNSQVHIFKKLQWRTPDFAIDQKSEKIICSKCNHEPLKQFDLNTGQDTKIIKHPFYTLNISLESSSKIRDPCLANNIKCLVLDQKNLAVLNSNNGCLVLHDLRTENDFIRLPEVEEKHSNESWFLSGFDFEDSNNYFGILSNCENFYIYDRRNTDNVLKHERLNVPFSTCNRLKMKFSNRDMFSVSGFDSNVNVYGLQSENFELSFVHDGHAQKKELTDSNNVVTDHIWLSSVGNCFLISICDNKTLHCWEFNK